MNLDAAIERASALGLKVHNLFQRDDGLWQANVRRRRPDMKHDYHHQFGKGDTPGFALNYAIELAEEDLAKGLPEEDTVKQEVAEEEVVGRDPDETSWEDL
jgi:hypothetical protein